MRRDAFPSVRVCHVVDVRITTCQFGNVHVHQLRRSIMLRWWKRVEIRETGAAPTRSTSWMNSIVSSVSCSNRLASRLAASRSVQGSGLLQEGPIELGNPALPVRSAG